MFPDSIIVENPRVAAPLMGYKRLLAEWFANDPRRVADWICGNNVASAEKLPRDIHVTEWRDLVHSLGSPAR